MGGGAQWKLQARKSGDPWLSAPVWGAFLRQLFITTLHTNIKSPVELLKELFPPQFVPVFPKWSVYFMKFWKTSCFSADRVVAGTSCY